MPTARLRAAAHAAIGLLDSTPHSAGAHLGPAAMAGLLVTMARTALMAAATPV